MCASRVRARAVGGPRCEGREANDTGGVAERRVQVARPRCARGLLLRCVVLCAVAITLRGIFASYSTRSSATERRASIRVDGTVD